MHFRKSILLKGLSVLLILVVMGCSKDEETSSEPDDPAAPEPVVTTTTIILEENLVQKGPFIRGSSILIQELNDDLTTNGNSINTETNDDFGSFEIDTEVESTKLDITATGFYYNEVSGDLSDAQITLRAFVEISSENKININILTTLSRLRIKFLMINEELTYQAAKEQAEAEVLNVFNIPTSIQESLTDFESFDISQNGNGNAILLAISAILQGDNSVAELSELIAILNADLESDGDVDSENVLNIINNNSQSINAAQVKENLQNRFDDLEVDYTIPALENFIDSDGDGVINVVDVSLLSPLSDETLSNALPQFSWTEVDVVSVSYNFELSENEDFSELIFQQENLEETTVTLTEPLENNVTYYWRVNYENEDGELSEWETSLFTINLGAIAAISPQGDILDSKPELVWEDLENKTYNVEVATIEDFSTILFSEMNLETANLELPITLENNTTYYWRVRFIDENGVQSDWSSISSFSVNLGTLTNSSPTLETANTRPNFSWDAIENATYNLEVSNDETFSNLIFEEDNLTEANLDSPAILQNQTRYFWRVRYVDDNGVESDWVNSSFIIDIGSVDLISPSNTEGLLTFPNFDWADSIIENSTYELQVSQNFDFETLLLSQNNLSQSIYQSSDLLIENQVNYYWRVRVIDENNVGGAWSDINIWSLDINTPSIVEYSEGNDYRSFNLQYDELQFNPSYVGLPLQIQVATDANFNSITKDLDNLTANPGEVYNLWNQEIDAYGFYYYRARLVSIDGIPGGWTDPQSFDYDQDLIAPRLFLADEITIADFRPYIEWNYGGNILSSYTYRVTFATDGNFEDIVEVSNAIPVDTDSAFFTGYQIEETLNNETTYFYKVELFDENENLVVSDSSSFYIFI